jgi:hypothetical protein
MLSGISCPVVYSFAYHWLAPHHTVDVTVYRRLSGQFW